MEDLEKRLKLEQAGNKGYRNQGPSKSFVVLIVIPGRLQRADKARSPVVQQIREPSGKQGREFSGFKDRTGDKG